MKKLISVLIMFSLIFSLTACGGSKSDAPVGTDTEADSNTEKNVDSESIVIKVGMTTQTINGRHPEVQWMEYLTEQITAETNGKYQFEIYTDGQLGTDNDLLDMVRQGTMVITKAQFPALSSLDEIYTVCDMPFLWKDWDHMIAFCESGAVDELIHANSNLDEMNLYPLCTGAVGLFPVASQKAYYKPDDIKGEKIRCMESTMLTEAYKALGANGIPMVWSEVFTSLQQGVIDGMSAVTFSIYGGSFNDVASTITELNMQGSLQTMVINKDFWEGMPAEDQEAWQRAAEKSVKYHHENLQKENDWAFDQLVEAGMEGVRFEEIDYDAFRAAVQPVYDAHSEFADIIDAIENLEYESK